MTTNQRLVLLFAFSILGAIPCATNGRAQGGSAAEACANFLNGYIKGSKDDPPCYEGTYDYLIKPLYHCSSDVLQKAEKARRLCLGMRARQQDYDACNQTADYHRSLSGCTRVSNDQTQSTTDRSFAYVQIGNALALQTLFPSAFDYYDKAIKLDPQNVIAYAASAIAHWKWADELNGKPWAKDERKRAVADYRQANAIDAAKMREFTASNRELQQISAGRPDPVRPKPRDERPTFE